MTEPAWGENSPIEAAEILWHAWQSGCLIDALPAGCRPRTLEHGGAIQSQLEILAGTRFGWKIAATSTAGQRHIGVQRPLQGRLFSRFVIDDGGHVSLAKAKMHMRVAEAEFAFRIRRYDSAVITGAASLACDLHLAIELPDSRFARFETAGAAQLIADNSCSGQFVLGPAVAGWQGLDLNEQPVAVRVNGVEAAAGHGRDVLSGPLDALAWLAAELPRFGEQLRPGDIVTTGTAAAPVPISAGDQVVAEFPSLGTVQVTVDL